MTELEHILLESLRSWAADSEQRETRLRQQLTELAGQFSKSTVQTMLLAQRVGALQNQVENLEAQLNGLMQPLDDLSRLLLDGRGGS